MTEADVPGIKVETVDKEAYRAPFVLDVLDPESMTDILDGNTDDLTQTSWRERIGTILEGEPVRGYVVSDTDGNRINNLFVFVGPLYPPERGGIKKDAYRYAACVTEKRYYDGARSTIRIDGLSCEGNTSLEQAAQAVLEDRYPQSVRSK